MPDHPSKVVLDSHVFGRLEADPEASDLLTRLIFDGKVVVLVPEVVQNELRARPSGMPTWLPTRPITDATQSDADVFVSDDPTCRRRVRAFASCDALTYDEFADMLKILRLG